MNTLHKLSRATFGRQRSKSCADAVNCCPCPSTAILVFWVCLCKVRTCFPFPCRFGRPRGWIWRKWNLYGRLMKSTKMPRSTGLRYEVVVLWAKLTGVAQKDEDLKCLFRSQGNKHWTH